MLGLDDPLVLLRDVANEETSVDGEELSRWPNVLPLGACAFIAPVNKRELVTVPGVHEILCFRQWFAVVLPDVTVIVDLGSMKLRDWCEPTRRVLDRNHRHWKAEHRERLTLPEAPI